VLFLGPPPSKSPAASLSHSLGVAGRACTLSAHVESQLWSAGAGGLDCRALLLPMGSAVGSARPPLLSPAGSPSSVLLLLLVAPCLWYKDDSRTGSSVMPVPPLEISKEKATPSARRAT